ncbi:MAG: GspH/FimT family pseudopilin [Burkholderiaceae bacterium]|nr:GspH/FimT family pseudopilin [Burkholderiaceae bacterium]
MITIAVAAVLVSLATPSFQDLLQRNRATGITNEFHAALAQARGLAIANNTCATLCTAAVSATGAPVCSAPGSNGYQSGWIIFTNPACDAAQTDPTLAGAVLRQARSGRVDGFSIVASGATLQRLMFDPRGISTAAADGLFQVSAPNDSGNVYARTICLDAAGRATVRRYTTTCA